MCDVWDWRWSVENHFLFRSSLNFLSSCLNLLDPRWSANMNLPNNLEEANLFPPPPTLIQNFHKHSWNTIICYFYNNIYSNMSKMISVSFPVSDTGFMLFIVLYVVIDSNTSTMTVVMCWRSKKEVRGDRWGFYRLRGEWLNPRELSMFQIYMIESRSMEH